MLTAVFLYVALFAVAFLLGSIPWGVIISKVFFHKDIRLEGSGNIGTTNAMRSLGKVGGAAVFVLDFGKGLLSGFLATAFTDLIITQPDSVIELYTALAGDQTQALLAINGGEVHATCLGLAFLGCVWGHIFSPWLGFKGGKGIAVAVGCLFVTFGPIGALEELALFIVLVVITRYVSVGSIAAAATCPLFALYFCAGHPFEWALVSLAAITVVWAHRENIMRLIHGNENRIGSKKKQANEAADDLDGFDDSEKRIA